MLTLTLTPSLAEAELISPMSLRILPLWEALNVDVWITMWPTSWHAGLEPGRGMSPNVFHSQSCQTVAN